MTKYEYEKEYDILNLYLNDNPEDIYGSLPFNNLVIDIAKDGSIVGLQIDNASDYLGVSPSLLQEIISANIRVIVQPDAVCIRWEMTVGKKENIRINNGFAYPRNKVTLSC